MRKDLSVKEMCGPLSFEFYARTLDEAQAEKLCGVLEALEGVTSVQRTSVSQDDMFDTYTVVVLELQLPYFHWIHQEVIRRAHAALMSGL